jgi:predicted LPLAT superfamily acyltransferase
MSAPQAWLAQPERGSRMLMRLITRLTLLLGRPAGRVLLYPICAYFLFFSRRARRASRDYLRRVLQQPPHWSDVFRHYLCFATTILDRTYLLAGRIDYFDCRIQGVDELLAIVSKQQGCLLFGAHFGSFEMLRLLATAKCPVPVRILMHEQNAKKLNSVFRTLNPDLPNQIIPLGQPQTMLSVSEALARGEVVGLLADRVAAGDKLQRCPFLGSPASFPEGPLILAAALRVPVVLFSAIYLGGRRYDVQFKLFAERVALPRDNRSEALQRECRRYAEWLAANCRAAPYNWFNFYDFWQHGISR